MDSTRLLVVWGLSGLGWLTLNDDTREPGELGGSDSEFPTFDTH